MDQIVILLYAYELFQTFKKKYFPQIEWLKCNLMFSNLTTNFVNILGPLSPQMIIFVFVST